MYNYLKNVIVKLSNPENNISFNSNISLNTRIGKGNVIDNSSIFNSILHNNSSIKQASIFSSKIGSATAINGASIFSGKIDDHVVIGDNTTISSSAIRSYTYFAGNNRVFNAIIGSFCSIAENVSIGHAEHPYNQLSTSPAFYKKSNPFGMSKFLIQETDEFKETIIGNDVWIGLNAYIKSGVVIGNGCIIGAGSVVTKNVEPYSIIAGVPGKLLKKRFDDLTINKLQQDCWWNMSDEEILTYAQNFVNGR